jgi:hypothetical protein
MPDAACHEMSHFSPCFPFNDGSRVAARQRVTRLGASLVSPVVTRRQRATPNRARFTSSAEK